MTVVEAEKAMSDYHRIVMTAASKPPGLIPHGNIGQGIMGQGSQQGPVPPAFGGLAHSQQIFGAARVGRGGNYAAEYNTAGHWLEENVKAIEALKKVMEYIAAQEAMDLFKGDPIAADIFRTFIRQGMNSLMGTNK